MTWHAIWFLCGAICGASAFGLGILYAFGGGFNRDQRPGKPRHP